MSDLKYTVEVSGLKDVEQLEKNLDRLHSTLNAGQGSGKSLEEMRKILVGMKGQSSVIADLRDSVKSLNSAAENLGNGFESGFNRLDKTLKQGFQLALDRMNMLGAEMSKGLTSGVSGAFDAGAQAASGGGAKLAKGFAAANAELEGEIKNAAAHARKVATAAYTELVGGDGMLGIEQAMAGEIARLRSAGATISKYHADILKGYEDTFKKEVDLENERHTKMLATKERNRKSEAAAELAAVKQGAKFLTEQRKNLEANFKEIEVPMVRKFLGLPDPGVAAAALEELKTSIIAKYKSLEDLQKQYSKPDAVFTSLYDGQLKGSLAKVKEYYRALQGEVKSHSAVEDSIVGTSIGRQRRVDALFDKTAADTVKRQEKLAEDILSSNRKASATFDSELQKIEDKRLKDLKDREEKVRKSWVAEGKKTVAAGKSILLEYRSGMEKAYKGVQEPQIRKFLGIPEKSESDKLFSELKQDIISRHDNIQKDTAAAAKRNKNTIQEPGIRNLLGLPDPAKIQQEFRNLELQVRNHYKQMDALAAQYAKPTGVYSSLSTKELRGSKNQLQQYYTEVESGLAGHGQQLEAVRSKMLDAQRRADQIFEAAAKGHIVKLKSIRSTQAKEATKAYEDLVSRDPKKTLTPQLAEELSVLKQHGASLSQWHNNLISEYRKFGTLYLQEMDEFAAKKQRKLDKQLADAKAAGSGVPSVVTPGGAVGAASQAADLDKLSKAQDRLRASSDPLRGALRGLAVDGNDVHSAMRGLASGFNLLWLTWGKLAPLFAGAGISYTLTQAFSIGSEVEYQIRFMEELGHTADSTGKRIEGAGTVIRQELRKLNEESMFSIVELSKAMTDLGQTNYTVAESLQILRPATALATAGLVDLNTATKTLIQVNALFGRTAEDTGRTAAQLFHITKSSVLNVENLAGSFMYASEVNTKFQGSLEETLVLFSALSKAGIKNNAAGTSMINMYRDIYGRSGPAIKALEGLRKATGDSIKTFDEFGKRRPILDIFEDIHKAAQKLPLEIADKYLSSLYSARGGRNHFALAREDIEKLREELEKLVNVKPEDLFTAAKGLMDTTKGATEILKSSMTNTLDEVFEAYEKSFKEFIVSITAGIRSDEFKSVLMQITAAAQGLFTVIRDNFSTVKTLTELFIGWKVLTFTTSVVGGLAAGISTLYGRVLMLNGGMLFSTKSIADNSRALGLNAVASSTSSRAVYERIVAQRLLAAGYTQEAAFANAASVATNLYTGAATRATLATRVLTSAIAFLTNPIVGVAVALGILASAYATTSSAADRAATDMGDSSDRYTNKSIADINREIQAITARNLVMNNADDYSEQQRQLDNQVHEHRKAVDKLYKMIEGREEKFSTVPALKRYYDTQSAALQQRESELNQTAANLDDARRKSSENRARLARERTEAAVKEAEKLKQQLEGVLTPTAGPAGPAGPGGFGNASDPAVDKVKLGLKELTSSYTLAESIMEAQRQAGLLGEKEYYEVKRRFIELNSEAHQEAFAAEEQILLQRKLKGADALARDAKVAEIRAEMAQRAQATAGQLIILDIEQAAAADKQAAAILEAKQAMEEYIQTIERASSLTVSGMGRGDRWRQDEEGRLNVKDKFADQRKKLANQRASELSKSGGALTKEATNFYKDRQKEIDDAERRALAAYQAGIDKRKLAEADWSIGASRALENYAEQAANVAEMTSSIFSTAIKGMEDALVEFAMTGKLSFSDLARSIIADIIRIQVKAAMSGLFGNILGSLLPGGAAATGGNAGSGLKLSSSTTASFGLRPHATGGVYNSPSLSAFSNQVHDSPKLFAFAKGAGVFAEAGPEAIMPLTRTADGNLGVRAVGGEARPSGGVVVNIHNHSGSKVEQSSRTDNFGREIVDIVVKQAVAEVAGQLATGSGQVGQAMTARSRMGM